MMDPLSFAASLSALTTVAFQLVSYVASVKSGGEERRNLGAQLTALWLILQKLQQQFASDLARGDKSLNDKLMVLQEPGGVLAQIGAALTTLQDVLMPKTGGKKLLQSLTWPLDKYDVDRKVQQIYQLHQLLSGFLTQVNMALTQDIRKDSAEMKDLITGDELRLFLDWLSPLNSVQRQQLIFKDTRAGTGKWFLNCDAYKEWEGGTGSILWCPGIPGAGKSFLSSIVVDCLQTLQSEQKVPKTIVLTIYVSFDDPNSQSPDQILGSLLKQILQYRSEVPIELRKAFRKHRNDGTKPSHDELVKSLTSELAQFQRIYIVVDALDELLEESKRRSLIESIIGLDDKINLLVTSRPIDNIRAIFGSSLTEISCDGCEEAYRLPADDSFNAPTKRDRQPHHFFYHCCDCEDDESFDLCQSCYEGVALVNSDHARHEFVKSYCSLSVEILATDEDLGSYVRWRIDDHDALRRCVDKKVGLRDQILNRVIESAQGM
jgi:ankyrin repeat domain-containing protein 50